MSEEVHETALDLLSRREHSRRELARKLRRKGHAREDIEAELDRLEAVGLVSDERYARLFARDRLAVNPQGKRRVVQALRLKGIEPELADAAVETVYAEEGVTDRTSAERLARRRLPALVALDRVAKKRRLTGYLARRGFGAETVVEVIRAVMDER